MGSSLKVVPRPSEAFLVSFWTDEKPYKCISSQNDVYRRQWGLINNEARVAHESSDCLGDYGVLSVSIIELIAK